jgi:D-serine deaminase-like pyridoxal phosphate-dependent protein
MTSLAHAETPALVLDRRKLEDNILRMSQRAQALNVTLRPHLKTAKSVDIARLLAAQGAAAITVSTLQEAEYFHAAGINDILYAVSIAPAKADRAARLIQDGARVQLILDHPEAARRLIEKAQLLGIRFDVLIEIDVDGHRAGLEPDDPTLTALAEQLHTADGIDFQGVMTHAGEAYACRDIEELERHAELERSRCVAAADHIRSLGIPCPVVSVGSTPTALCAAHLDGVTELRAGVYVFFDLFQAGLGVCSVTDISLSVLTTVISHKISHRRLIIDAGGLALSKDHSTAVQTPDPGYGLVLKADTGEIIPGLKVSSVDQEHGIVALPDEADFSRFPVGSRLRILPNHACMTAAAHTHYLMVDGDQQITDRWERCNGW